MKSTKDFFWPSYVDLLTGLFIVMLVLFVLSYKLLSDSKKVTEDKLKKIEEVQRAVSNLPASIFEYQPQYKRYALTKQIQFAKGSDIIPHLDYNYLLQVGHELNHMIEDLKVRYINDSIKYLIVIEGMASTIGGTDYSNYLLSYQRAKSIYDYWTNNDISFDKNVCEVMISGSGLGGVGRYTDNEEYKNQRILIQIVPKISNFINDN